MKSEQYIQNEIRLALSSIDSIVLRTNAGEFWQGKRVFSKEFNQMVLINLKKIDGLPRGHSDLVCYSKGGKTAFIECKNETYKPTDEQVNFLNRMRSLGFNSGIARSVEDAIKIMEGNYGE